MVARTYTSPEEYRYGFNGQERETDSESFDYDFGERIFDSRLCRFLSVDPLVKRYTSFTPYNFGINSPLQFRDVIGLGPGFTKILDGFQLVLDIAGMIPAVGEIADLANAGISAARGDYVSAGLSMASMIPFAGWAPGIAKIGKRVDGLLSLSDEAVEATSKSFKKNTPEINEVPTQPNPSKWEIDENGVYYDANNPLGSGAAVVTPDLVTTTRNQLGKKVEAVYEIRFSDGSTYTGQTNDLKKRLYQHFNAKKGKFSGKSNEVEEVVIHTFNTKTTKTQREILEQKVLDKNAKLGPVKNKKNPVSEDRQKKLKEKGQWDNVTLK